MILTECDSCAEGRASGAAFCEACGRPLTETAAVGDGAEPPNDKDDGGGTPVSPAAGPRRGRDCPHCAAAGAVDADGYCEECGLLAGRPRDHVEADGDTVAAAVSDRGRRHHRNEDAMWLAVGVEAADVVVCDGVSSSFDPDVASEAAARAAGDLLARAQHPLEPAQVAEAADAAGATGPVESVAAAGPADDDVPRAAIDPEAGGEPDPGMAIAEIVATAIQEAGQAVAALVGNGDPRRAASNPACTIVAAAVRGPHVGFGWVGDSRAYWVTAGGPAQQLTEDDSWARHVIAMGADPRVAMNDPKAHAITAWLGADAGPILPHLGAFTAQTPGHLVLCSDGLWNYLTDPADFGDAVRSALTLATGPRPLLEAARALVAYANSAGGADNITVAIVPVVPRSTADAEGDADITEPSEA
ncbi:protein kinase [Actinoplanes sp. SE50]|uniref:PP2C family protein-serine/threonine phosphatase n=1 Tax=unclassified Actinoplanes TaxID=2626549 RepID=UPI00023ED0DA|nr:MULTISPECIES: PP2C family serine/threonine-protein phosphatase [unclassified Actinoplanes]AEV86096.1 Protein kinase and PP2C-like domain-containing protein [Actinoplanes sp. SE50/110]ATO84494.1 protein kinase [Actinoplanes sp. SE50]SLM01904.1 protein kinase [Actinoplanes sp. SE50/110]